MKSRLLYVFLAATLLLTVPATQAWAVTFEIAAEGKSQTAAESDSRLKALRLCMNEMLTQELMKKHALAIREHVVKKMYDMTTVEVLEKSQKGKRVRIRAMVTVDRDRVHTALLHIPELSSFLTKHGEEGHSAPASHPVPERTPKDTFSPPPNAAPSTQPQRAQQASGDVTDEQFLALLQNTGTEAESILNALKNGANANVRCQTELGELPALMLYLKTKHPDPAVVEAFIKAGAETNWVSADGKQSIVAQAILTHNNAVLLAVLKTKPKFDSADPDFGYQLLHTWLSAEKSPEMLQAFLDAGFDPNMISRDSCKTPFLFEVIKGVRDIQPLNPALLERLLKAGANPNCTNIKGETALHYAVALNAPEQVSLLLEMGADPNSTTQQSETPLILACDQKKTDMGIVTALLQHKADPNLAAPARYNLTPLIAAVRQGREDIVDALLKANANLDTQATDGRTALIFSLENNEPSLTRKLLSAGANPNLSDNASHPPLFSALRQNKLELVKLLVENGANIKAELGDQKEKRTLKELVDLYGSEEIRAYFNEIGQ